MTLGEFFFQNMGLILAAARRGEAPLSGAAESFKTLGYTDRRRAGKIARDHAARINLHIQTGTRQYRHTKAKGSTHSRLAIFASAA
jgi:hypothetical protein